jgi:hypothetical protein
MTRAGRQEREVLRNEWGAGAEQGRSAFGGETIGERSATVSLSEFYGSITRSLMSGQPQLYSSPEPAVPPSSGDEPVKSNDAGPAHEPGKRTAPVWLQRLSLFVLVLFCVYLGVLVMVLPWWTRIWDRNEFILARPWLAAILRNGAVRGMISGLGLLDIWIGISEAVHYRDYRG